ncbi:hypothetical protein BH20VER2_BH20VER2_06420 [soil metagenome]
MSGPAAAHQLIAPDVKLGRGVRIFGCVNLYGCEIGDETKHVPPNATVAGNPARPLRAKNSVTS